MNPSRRQFTRLGAACAATALAPAIFAQSRDAASDYPNRAIKLIVPFGAGGGTDLVGRSIGQKLAETWGQPVVVENRAGGNGTIGLDSVAKSPADGYTLTMVTASASVNVTLQGRKQPYDLLRDLAPVTQITRQPYVLCVNPKVPARTLPELLAYAKTRAAAGDPIRYGSSGIGGLSHLAGALLGKLSGIPMVHVPYRGGHPALVDVIGGQIEIVFATRIESHGAQTAGTVRPLAVSTATRSPASPDLPTVAEAGVPGYEVGGWYGMLAPAATPPAIVRKLHNEIARVLELPDVIGRMATDGSEGVGSRPAEFGAHIKREVDRWAKLIAEMRIPTE